MRQTFEYLDPVGDKPFHISFDIDAIDPHFAFGTGTKFRGGLTPIEANQIVRATAHYRNLVGLDVVEINKQLEMEDARMFFRGESKYGMVSPTVGLGLDLIDSVFTTYFTLWLCTLSTKSSYLSFLLCIACIKSVEIDNHIDPNAEGREEQLSLKT